MCMWFGFNPAVNFCHFSTLSFLAGAASTSLKFDLYFYCYKMCKLHLLLFHCRYFDKKNQKCLLNGPRVRHSILILTSV